MTVPNRAAADRECPHCKSALPRLANVCPACTRWVVDTQLHPAALVLRVVGYAWIVLSLLGAVVLAQGEVPFGGSYAVPVAIALQGVLVGLVAVVIAENGPRQPE